MCAVRRPFAAALTAAVDALGPRLGEVLPYQTQLFRAGVASLLQRMSPELLRAHARRHALYAYIGCPLACAADRQMAWVP